MRRLQKLLFLCAQFMVTVNIFCGHAPSLKATCLSESFKLWSYNRLEGQVFSPKPLLPNGELQYFKFILQNFVCSTNYLPLCPTFYKAMDTENAGLTCPNLIFMGSLKDFTELCFSSFARRWTWRMRVSPVALSVSIPAVWPSVWHSSNNTELSRYS